MAVRDFLMDANGDLAVVNGDFATAADEVAVKQGIVNRVRMFLGEYWLDESIGVDWIGKILIKNPDPILIREQIKEAILATPDVTAVLGTDLRIDSQRNASITYQVTSKFSSTPINGIIQ